MNQTIEIPDTILSQATRQVALGHFASLDEALGHITKQLQQYDEAFRTLKSKVDQSFDSGEPVDAEDVFTRLHQHIDSQSS